MYRVPINFHKRLMRGESPIPYIVIDTHMGYRAYAEKELAKVFEVAARLADGTYTADGTYLAGGDSAGVIAKDGRVISFGSFERSLQSAKDDILGAYSSKTLQSMTVELDNSDGKLALLIASEPFIGRPVKAYVGFGSDPQSEHLETFSGIITELSVMQTMTIEANEE